MTIEGWEHHELRRSRRDLYYVTHEVAIREAHQLGGDLRRLDFRAIATLADVVEGFAATSRTGSRPPDAPPIDGDDGVNRIVLDLADALVEELTLRRDEAEGVAIRAITNLLDKATWAADVLRLRT